MVGDISELMDKVNKDTEGQNATEQAEAASTNGKILQRGWATVTDGFTAIYLGDL